MFLLPPLKIAKIAKAGKLEDVVKLLDEIVSKSVRTGKAAPKDGKSAATQFFKAIEDFIQILKNGTDDVNKLIDEITQTIKKWLQETFGIGKKVSKSNYDELSKVYGKLVAKGSSVIKQKYSYQFQKLVKEADLPKMQRKFKEDLTKKKPKPKNEELYLRRRKQSYINFEKGNVFEDIFKKYNGGIKPDTSIKTAFTNRFIDNVKGNAARELKSGYIKMNAGFKKQVRKDIDILANELDDQITKVEWHIVEGIDEVCLKYIQTMAREKNVLNQITIVLY